MTRGHGRCPKGERLRMGFPHGHRKTTTLVAGLRITAMVAPMVLDGPINGDWFEAYVARCWYPNCGSATSSSWTICRATSAPRRVSGSKQQARRCAFCLPTVPTSTRLKRPSRASRRCSEDRRAHRQRPLRPDRPSRRHLPTRRMRQLLHLMRCDPA